MKRVIAVLSIVLLLCLKAKPQTIPLNGDFALVGENGPNVTYTGGSGTSIEGAAKYWHNGIAVPGSTIQTELLSSTHPAGGNMIRFWTNNGFYLPANYGNGLFWAHGIPATAIPANTRLSFDIFVLSGLITGGLVQATGPFLDFTQYGPTGSWVHVEQVSPTLSGGIAFENLVSGAGAEAYFANVSLTYAAPEPSSLWLITLGVPLLVIRRRCSSKVR